MTYGDLPLGTLWDAWLLVKHEDGLCCVWLDLSTADAVRIRNLHAVVPNTISPFLTFPSPRRRAP